MKHPKLLEQTLIDAPVMKRGDYTYFIHPLTDSIPPITAELLEEVSKAIVIQSCLDVDYIVTMEAMGIHIGALVSALTDLPLNIIRKRRYDLDGEREIDQHTGYGGVKMYLNSVKEGDKVLIIDSVISTGGTLVAVIDALHDAKAQIKDICCVIERGDGVEKVKKETGLDVKTLVKIEVTPDGVKILK